MMRNKILEQSIKDTVDSFHESDEFKAMLIQYIENRFRGNVSDNDLLLLLNYLEATEDDLQ